MGRETAGGPEPAGPGAARWPEGVTGPPAAPGDSQAHRPSPGTASEPWEDTLLPDRLSALAAALDRTRQRLATVLTEVAQTEDRVAQLNEDLARQRPERAADYQRTAEKARQAAVRARELAAD